MAPRIYLLSDLAIGRDALSMFASSTDSESRLDYLVLFKEIMTITKRPYNYQMPKRWKNNKHFNKV